jgi:hypothetical protein
MDGHSAIYLFVFFATNVRKGGGLVLSMTSYDCCYRLISLLCHARLWSVNRSCQEWWSLRCLTWIPHISDDNGCIRLQPYVHSQRMHHNASTTDGITRVASTLGCRTFRIGMDVGTAGGLGDQQACRTLHRWDHLHGLLLPWRCNTTLQSSQTPNTDSKGDLLSAKEIHFLTTTTLKIMLTEGSQQNCVMELHATYSTDALQH